MKYFVFKMKHDNGTVYLKVIASGRKQAIKNVVDFEGCPESAAQNVLEVPSLLFSMSCKTLFKKGVQALKDKFIHKTT